MKVAQYLLMAIFLAFLPVTLIAAEFHVDKSAKSLVKFTSQASLENFSGQTDKIDGYILLSGFDSLDASEIHFEVELNKLDTGIGLRNRHMRENYLETEKYPLAIFHGKAFAIKKQSDQTYLVTARGIFSLHGVDKEMEIAAAVAVNDRQARVTSDFKLKLGDFGITIPKLMFMKVTEIMPVHVDFYIQQVNP